MWATVGNPGYAVGDPLLVGTQAVGSNKYVQVYDPVFALSIADANGNCVQSTDFTQENIVVRFGQRVVTSCKYDMSIACENLAVLSKS